MDQPLWSEVGVQVEILGPLGKAAGLWLVHSLGVNLKGRLHLPLVSFFFADDQRHLIRFRSVCFLSLYFFSLLLFFSRNFFSIPLQTTRVSCGCYLLCLLQAPVA